MEAMDGDRGGEGRSNHHRAAGRQARIRGRAELTMGIECFFQGENAGLGWARRVGR